MMYLVWRCSLDIRHLLYVSVCTSVCLLETCAYVTKTWCISSYHSHLSENINIVIHVQCIEERNGMKVFF